MPPSPHGKLHRSHAFEFFQPRVREGLVCTDRRGVLKAGLAGLAGITLPGLLQQREQQALAGENIFRDRSVILLWLTGGPSHIDMWDVKPHAPQEIRGPFQSIATSLPGVAISEHLPKQAAMLDHFTLIRSVDALHSNHEPNMVMQTGNREAAPRVNPLGHMHPAIASIVGKFRGPERPGVPPYVATMKSTSHLAWGGWLGKEYDPFIANDVKRTFQLSKG
ncbi:MAG: DUF1501 domain-containing protein, partial [Planctomycetaceae bacterium]|nr:DUF1501 domain-containing protein [Planctomycetaceae bacterium]